MAVSYGSASTPVATTTASTAVAYPTGITSGQKLFLIGAIKVGSTAMSATPALSGWTVEAFVRHGTTASGNDAGSMAFCVWSRTADGSESGNVTVAWGITPAAGQAWIVRLSNATNLWSTSTVTATRTLSTTAWSVTFTDTAGLTAGDLALIVNAVPTDLNTASSAGTLTAVGLTSGSATERLTHRTDAGGSDSAVWLDSFAPSAGTATAAPTYSSTLTGGTNLYGVAVLIRARELALPPQATGSGTWTFTGAGSGVRSPASTGSGAWLFAGAGTGYRSPQASGAGSWAFTGAGAGSRLAEATGSGSFTFTGAGTGQTPVEGPGQATGAGSWTFTGTGAGGRSPKASGSGSWSFTGAGVGQAPVSSSSATGQGFWSFTGAGVGHHLPMASGSGTWTFTGSGVAEPPLIPAVLTATVRPVGSLTASTVTARTTAGDSPAPSLTPAESTAVLTTT